MEIRKVQTRVCIVRTQNCTVKGKSAPFNCTGLLSPNTAQSATAAARSHHLCYQYTFQHHVSSTCCTLRHRVDGPKSTFRHGVDGTSPKFQTTHVNGTCCTFHHQADGTSTAFHHLMRMARVVPSRTRWAVPEVPPTNMTGGWDQSYLLLSESSTSRRTSKGTAATTTRRRYRPYPLLPDGWHQLYLLLPEGGTSRTFHYQVDGTSQSPPRSYPTLYRIDSLDPSCTSNTNSGLNQQQH